MKTLSTQSEEIYKLLLAHKAMTAKTIGSELKIFPNAIYRALKPLLKIGLVNEIAKYPAEFETKSTNEAVDLYSMFFRQQFQTNFKNSTSKGKMLNITFIANRNDLLEKTQNDLKQAKQSLNFIVSGLEVPAETVLAYKEAIERDVKIKAIVQNLTETSKEMFKSWIQTGVKIRYFPNLEARIFIFDEKIVYFTSYNPNRQEEALGVRFDYPPLARLISEMFDQRWDLSKKI